MDDIPVGQDYFFGKGLRLFDEKKIFSKKSPYVLIDFLYTL